MAVFMSGIAENQTTISSKNARVGDRRHIGNLRIEQDRSGTHTAMYTQIELGFGQSRLGLGREKMENEQ
jgi:hypothetical protein